jgi:hypothetical protein
MIINPISLGCNGLLPEIIVTAPSGSTLDLMQGSVVLQTCTLGSSETQHTFTVKKTGTYTVRGTNGSNTASVEVSVDEIGQYYVEMTIDKGKLWLYKDGDECEDVTGGWGWCWKLSTYTNGFITKNADNITFGEETDGYGNLFLFTSNLIDMSRYSTLHCIMDVTHSYQSNSSYPNGVDLYCSPNEQTQGGQVSLSDDAPHYGYFLSSGETFSGKELVLDISDVSTPMSALLYAFSFSLGADKITAVLHKMWIE